MQRSSRNKRRGWTLVDVLVVSGCLLVVLALTTPALTQFRSDARRQTCQNNLKQLALAMHNYHDTHRIFPPGWVTAKFEPNTGSRFGWQSFLLPFVEQLQIYRQLDFKKPMPEAKGVLQTEIAAYRCPDDAMRGINPLRGDYGTSNYSGNFGTARGNGPEAETLAHWLGPRRARYWPGQQSAVQRTNGIFWIDSNVRLRPVFYSLISKALSL